MIDIKFLRENPDAVTKSSKDKGIDIDVSHILEIDKKYQELSSSVQVLREERNKLAKERNIEEGKKLKEKLEKEEQALKSVEDERTEWFSKIPNPALLDIQVGDESKNEIVKTVGEIKKLDFKPLDHLELAEALDLIDVKRAAKVSGSRFAYLKGDAALLEFAIVQFALETLTKEGFIPVVPPVLINKEITGKLGYWNSDGSSDFYYLNDADENKEMYLVGTAEHSIVPMHMDETFAKKDLPRRYVAFSSAFRREAGTYGKDTRGILRVHQFDKVEMVSIVAKEDDKNEHQYLLSLEEKFWQALDIPYQVVKMATGDLGFPIAGKFDIEAWIPSEGKYREVTSCSTTTDFQARRLNIKYQEGDEKKFAYILNGTAFAIGRTIVAILENYQQEDGSILIPEVLQKYMGKSVIKR